MRPRRAILGLAALALVACGGGDDDDDGTASTARTARTATTATAAPSAVRGQRLVEQRGCINCHTTDGRSEAGPTWKGLAGSQVRLSDGRTVTADDDYLTRSIREPDADTVVGYVKGVMAGAMPGRPLTSGEVADIVAYLKSL